MRRLIPSVFALSISLSLQGCYKSQEAFLQIQTCVVDQSGVTKLIALMRNIARDENLRFVDNSANVRRELKAIDADNTIERNTASTIDLHIEGKRGLGVSAGNLGLPPYQIVLGFTEGTDRAKAHRLAKRLVSELSNNWHVEVVPQGKGTFPMKSCGE
jgi:hypothetical protein